VLADVKQRVNTGAAAATAWVDALAEAPGAADAELIAGVEARGFLLAAAV